MGAFSMRTGLESFLSHRTLPRVVFLCVRAYGAATHTPPPIATLRGRMTVFASVLTSNLLEEVCVPEENFLEYGDSFLRAHSFQCMCICLACPQQKLGIVIQAAVVQK